ncbi:hypothetical protein CYMTET_19097 [Cymbomonas tetramitiformis]|uniref:Uncharacterized protein n=1 Tax=Cymbomonas tetramitiformis TaxID=36881 RepID=A0AAE0G7C0_9CHLO|nr:hypothetical protein CYMTET_19097 [Cymbomonas tetramitiformis]
MGNALGIRSCSEGRLPPPDTIPAEGGAGDRSTQEDLTEEEPNGGAPLEETVPAEGEGRFAEPELNTPEREMSRAVEAAEHGGEGKSLKKRQSRVFIQDLLLDTSYYPYA